jgi:hypothetical protein
MQAAFLAGSMVFSAASVDEPVMATAKAAADNNMVMERNMFFSFSKREASSVGQFTESVGEESLAAGTPSSAHEKSFRATQFRQMP